MVQKFNFKHVQEEKEMKYLGIILSRDLEDMPLLNFNPLLHKIKTNLDKWEHFISLISLLKMTIAPQFNYISMVFIITIPPNIFLIKYEGMFK